MAKRKLSPTIRPNTLESMIEYILVSSIFKKIYEMTKKPSKYPRDNTKFPHAFAWNQHMGNIMEENNWQNGGMGGIVMDKENIFIMKQSVNISKDDMEEYNLVMFTHAMDFFKERASLKKLIP